MPKPVTGLHLRIDPHALLSRPELAAHIALVSTQWSVIEDRLAHIYAMAMGANVDACFVSLAKVINIRTRLDMIAAVLERAVSEKMAADFEKLKKLVTRRSAERARIVHSIWCVDDGYPEALIRWRGSSDPELRFEAYDAADFSLIELHLVEVEARLTEFAERLARVIQERNPALGPVH